MEISAARFRVQIIINLRNYLYNRLKKTPIIEIKYHNAKHIFISFNIKNKGLLNFKNLNMTKSFKKINHKYYNSFEIEFFIEKQVYCFRLFKTFKSIHNVFYVSLLKFHRKNFENQFLSIMMKEEKQ